MKIGFDVDGTLTTKMFSIFHNNPSGDRDKIPELLPAILDFVPSNYLKLLKAYMDVGDDVYIISFRWEDWAYYTKVWLSKYGVDIDKIHFEFPPKHITTNCPEKYCEVVVGYKIEIINKHKLDIYYEDTDFIVEGLKVSCPDTKIVHVKL